MPHLPYSLTRNPLYFFSFLGVAGFFYALHNLPVLALAVLLFLGYYHFVIKGEERRLAILFGDDYSQYIQSTPRFFPAFRAMRGKESYTIQPKIAPQGRDVHNKVAGASCSQVA